MVILIIGFQMLKFFVWHMEIVQRKTLSYIFIFRLSFVQLCQSIRVIKGRNAMAKHSQYTCKLLL